jgi:hypothetical protein
MLFLGSVQAEDGTEPQLVYLPLIYNEKYTNPWLGPDGGFVVNMVTNPTIQKLFMSEHGEMASSRVLMEE